MPNWPSPLAVEDIFQLLEICTLSLFVVFNRFVQHLFTYFYLWSLSARMFVRSLVCILKHIYNSLGKRHLFDMFRATTSSEHASSQESPETKTSLPSSFSSWFLQNIDCWLTLPLKAEVGSCHSISSQAASSSFALLLYSSLSTFLVQIVYVLLKLLRLL